MLISHDVLEAKNPSVVYGGMSGARSGLESWWHILRVSWLVCDLETADFGCRCVQFELVVHG